MYVLKLGVVQSCVKLGLYHFFILKVGVQISLASRNHLIHFQNLPKSLLSHLIY